MLDIYKSQIQPKMEYCRYILDDVAYPDIPTMTDFKDVYAFLWTINYFGPYKLSPTDETLQISRYYIAISMANFQTSYIP